MRRFAGLLTLLTVASCALPEDGNPTPRCTVDAHCPEAMRCYRSYCIADEDFEHDAGLTTIAIDDRSPDARVDALDAGVRDASSQPATAPADASVSEPVAAPPLAAPVPPHELGKPPPPPKPKEPKPKPGGPGGPGRAPPPPPPQ